MWEAKYMGPCKSSENNFGFFPADADGIEVQ